MPTTQSQAKIIIQQLIRKYNALSEEDRNATTEASVVHQFIVPLFEALGWPVQDPARYKYELSTQAGRPDMTFFPEQGGVIFTEAKRFGAIKELAQARKTISGIITPGQLSLPGMATDRSPQEQQAINYAFKNGGTWAILTNFEKLRLFNARRDWLVLSFERPSAYLDDFDQLWQLSYQSVLNGQLDLLSNQRHREDVDADYLAFINEWREKLAQDIITHANANPWAFADAGQINLNKLRAVVQRVLDRLVVVRFAEDHLIAPAGTLYSLYELHHRNAYTFSLSELFARLYRRFDERHNSALFAPHLADQAVFSDEVLSGLINKLYEARYRAMSADIMGNTYEQYLGKTLVQVNGRVKTADNLETRKKQGSYYTPQVIVRYLVDNSLGRYLYGTANGRADGDPLPGETRKTTADIRELRIIDPASGSGSFLIYAYRVLADFYRSERVQLEQELTQKTDELAARGLNPIDIQIELSAIRNEYERLADYPNLILENHLYGVDLDPQAAELATVNLIMQAMADQSNSEKRLPLILNQNVKVGNSLLGTLTLPDSAEDLAELRRLRRLLPTETETGGHSATLQAIAGISGRLNAALNQKLAPCFDDPDTQHPFNWAVEFPEVFVDEQGQPKGDSAGFDIVIGNPPWEIIKPDLREYYAQFDPEIESRLTRRQVETRIKELNADPKIKAAWKAQKAGIETLAAYYKNSGNFTRQGRGDTATHKLFLERGYCLLKDKARLSFVIPSGIYTDLGTKDLRQMLLGEGQIDYLYNFSNERWFFNSVHHAFHFTLLSAQRGISGDGFWAAFRFNPRVAVAPAELADFLSNRENLVYIRRQSLRRFSPDSLSVMEFHTQRDYEIVEKIYGDLPLIGEEIADWTIKFFREFDMTNTRHLFNQIGNGVPLYEGKMIHQFNADFAAARFWIQPEDLRYKNYRAGVRAIAANTNERTLIAAVLPEKAGAGNSLLTIPEVSGKKAFYLVSLLNSFALDFVLRMKVTTNINMFYLYQLPLPRLNPGNSCFDAIVPRAARLTCVTSDFAELWSEAMGEDWDESKVAIDPAERQTLRNELDALIAHLYGLNRDDFAHILATFPLIFPASDEGETRLETLLAVYDHFNDYQ
ncbi:MAG TPA: N-6 DNA methylase [Chloroflexi bacterium]|nr:N-6 DNA methylase [Chloroflexota bacterium]